MLTDCRPTTTEKNILPGCRQTLHIPLDLFIIVTIIIIIIIIYYPRRQRIVRRGRYCDHLFTMCVCVCVEGGVCVC